MVGISGVQNDRIRVVMMFSQSSMTMRMMMMGVARSKIPSIMVMGAVVLTIEVVNIIMILMMIIIVYR